jgi:hypothetical protein
MAGASSSAGRHRERHFDPHGDQLRPGLRPPLPIDVRAPDHGLEPGAETARGVVLEVGQLLDQLGEDLARQILGVGLIPQQPAGTGEDAGMVLVHEPAPGVLVRAVEPPQQCPTRFVIAC